MQARRRIPLSSDCLRGFSDRQFLAIFSPPSIVFGPHGTEEMRKTFGTIVRKKNLDGESFKFEKDAVKPPRDRKFKTKEGVKIQYGEDAEDTVKVIEDENTGKTLITITTQQIIEM
jgi:hypothetical protein